MDIDQDRLEDDIVDIVNGRPTVEDIQQQNFTHPAVLVRADDPIPVQQLPTLSAQARNVVLNNLEPFKILNADPRRSRALVWTATQAVYIGTDQQAVRMGMGALLAVGSPPLEVRSTENWYVRAAVIGAQISVINEQWAQ